MDATWGKVKFDRQIIAIAKAEGADIIYTTDQNLAKQARAVGITCRGIEDLPMPQPVQEKLNYDKDKTQSEAEAIPLPTDVRRGDDGRASDETGTKRSEARTEQAAKEKKGKPPETPKGK